MADDKIEIELIVDGKPVRSTLKDLAKKIDKDGSKAGTNFGDKFGKSFRSQTAKLVATATAAGAAIGAALFGRASIRAAIVQQDAVNRLNSSLKSAGDFSVEASEDLQAFASSLQSVTRFGDETILNNIALAKSFGATNEQAKLVASASADLAAELGIDLQSATRNVAKTLGGYAGELGETIPALKSLTQEQLRAGAGVELLAKRFAGAASRDVKTYSGAVQQLENTFGDFQEAIGKFITDSPAVRGLIQGLSKAFDQAAKSIGKIDNSFIDTFILRSIDFSESVTKNILLPLGKVGAFLQALDGLTSGRDLLVAAEQSITSFAAKVARGFADAVPAGARAKEAVEGVASSVEAANRRINRTLERTNLAQGLDGVFSQAKGEQAATDFYQALRDKVQEQIDTQGSPLKKLLDAQPDDEEKQKVVELGAFYTEFFKSVGENSVGANNTVIGGFKAATEAAKGFAINQKKFIEGTARKSFDTFVGGVGRGLNNVGVALANGQNAFKAFGNAVLGTIGEIASGAGDAFIQLGIAETLAGVATGPALIAAGAALKVIGGFLSAKSGASAQAAPSGTSAGGGGGIVTQPDTTTTGGEDLFTDQEDITSIERGTVVNLTVQGDILDSQDTPRRLAELLNAGFDTEDIKLNQLGTA